MFDLQGGGKDYRTSYIKSLLNDEFGEKIGFQNRFQKNESTLVYVRSNGVNSWELNIEDLLRNFAILLLQLGLNSMQRWEVSLLKLQMIYPP